MFNKSIVIAALCNAADAAATGGASGAAGAKAGATPTKPAVTPTPAPKPTPVAVVHNAEAGKVLCDQGDSGIWKEADANLTALNKVAATAAAELLAATKPYNDQAAIVKTMLDAKDKHKKDNGKFVSALTAAEKVKNDLVTKAGVVIASGDTSAAKKLLLDAEKKKTTDAAALVDKQRARVEKLVEAKRAQDTEEAKWEARRAANNALLKDLETKVTEATNWETRVKETFTKRSFLFQMLGQPIDQDQGQADWKAGCAFGPDAATKSCDLMEKTSNNKSTGVVFWWGKCYDKVNQNATNTSGATECMPHGLDDDAATSGSSTDGLSTVATNKLGVQNNTTGGSNTATNLFKAYESANFEYAAAGNTKVKDALDAYLAWQKQEILGEMMWLGCWTGATNGGKVQAADRDANCKDAAGAGYYNVWIQYHQEQEIFGKASTGANALRLAFDQSERQADGTATYKNLDGGNPGKYASGSYKHISDNQVMLAAEALASIWIQGYVIQALKLEGVAVGVASSKALRSGTYDSAKQNLWDAINCTKVEFSSLPTGCKWSESILGKAEVAKAAAELNVTVNKEETAALDAWKALAVLEEAEVAKDLQRARDLLVTLTDDIAPIARKEFAAQAAYDAALKKEADKADATEKLGAETKTSGGTTTKATGAWAVVEAARVAKASIEEQQKFHDERWHWATDVLTPLKKTYDDAVKADTAAKAAVVVAKARLVATRDACKVAAFKVAQNALNKKNADDAGLKAKVDALKAKYTTTAQFPTKGAGALCNYPKDNADGSKPRKIEDDCGDDTLCCGAAQRFLKDGTKLTIETCQLKEATTYKYFPALPTGALVEPLPETWRFSCISAARKLAAAATAALATGYMMA